MRVVIQRVSEASVKIDGKIYGQIGRGYLLLVGFKVDDDHAIIDRMVEKIIHLRIFEDDQMKMNRSLEDIQGEILSISQFTLYANAKKGRRPSFVGAAAPDIASPLYDLFNERLSATGIHCEKGIFGADMKVSLINDGPVTILLDSEELFGK